MAISKFAPALLLALSLAGCAGPKITGICPAYVHYSRDDDRALLAELQGARASGQSMGQTYRYIRDYGKQRAALKVICVGD